MSQEQLKEIIGRAINDSAFRELLASDLDSALASYDLTDDERTLLVDAQGKDFNELLTNLEARISKGGPGPVD
jgi:hypothetical protein